MKSRTCLLILCLVYGAPVILVARTIALPLDSLTKIHEVTNSQASHHPAVDFEATVTYYRSYEHTLFVQDGPSAIYVYSPYEFSFVPGDRLQIRGSMQESFHPIVAAADITLLRHGPRINPITANYRDLSSGGLDGRLVKVHARVNSADISISSDMPNTRLVVRMNGGHLEAFIDNTDSGALSGLLDAEVEITAVASGRFGGKMEMTGIVLHATNMGSVRVLKRSAANPWSLPITRADRIFSAFSEDTHSQRIRVQGVITYYYPGSAVVLQDGLRSVWVNTHSREKLRVGDVADATGFPDPHDGFLRIREGEIRDSNQPIVLSPQHVKWLDLAQSKHVFDLVTLDARVVAEVREAARDTYVLTSEGHIFSAINRHPEQRMLRAVPLPPLKEVPIGSTVQVTGICAVEDPNPYNGAVPVDLVLRNSDDLQVIAEPSPITINNLGRIIALLLGTIFGIAGWGWMLRRRVRTQTMTIARNSEAESARERRNAQIEQRRAEILESINRTLPLNEILEGICSLVSFQINGAKCWCELAEGERFGNVQEEPQGRRVRSEDIPAHFGPAHGRLIVAFESGSPRSDEEDQAFFIGTRLVTLAIETRRLYTDLVRRSEFDLLTDVHNRFSLEKKLESVIEEARQQTNTFGLIFVDLDEFKQINDLYGHHIGDLYLQAVAARMKQKLRGNDLLARLGGDEFAVVVPAARTRKDVEDVAERLKRSFHELFAIEGLTISGSASIGCAVFPDDGGTNDTLLNAADAAMYVAKHTRREKAQQHASDVEAVVDSTTL